MLAAAWSRPPLSGGGDARQEGEREQNAELCVERYWRVLAVERDAEKHGCHLGVFGVLRVNGVRSAAVVRDATDARGVPGSDL